MGKCLFVVFKSMACAGLENDGMVFYLIWTLNGLTKPYLTIEYLFIDENKLANCS